MSSMQKVAMRKRTIPAVLSTLAVLGALLGVAACGSSGSGKEVTLVAYSTPQGAYTSLIPAFNATSEGKGVTFSQSYGPSGEQSRAVAAGLKADVVNFSLEPDVTRLVKAGLVSSDWNKNATHGFVTNSIAVIIVRKGNPKHITGWDDLIKSGVDVITPNPSTSGSARWNILAGYGAQLKEGKTPAQALAYVNTLLTKNVSVQDSSASAALQTFTGGKGDVLLDYESDALAAEKAGDSIQIVYPKQTILIQTPIAVTSKSSHAKQAQAFVNWQWSTAGQTIWAQQGYRPVLASVANQFTSKFPTPPSLFTIDYLGGWTKVSTEFFAPSTGSITKIEEAAGVPTAS